MPLRLAFLAVTFLLTSLAHAQPLPEPPVEDPEPVADEYYWAIVNRPPDPLPTPDRVIVCPDQKPTVPRLLFRDYIEATFRGNLLSHDRSDQFHDVDIYSDGSLLAVGTRWGNVPGLPGRTRIWIVRGDAKGKTRRAIIRPPSIAFSGDWRVEGWVMEDDRIGVSAIERERGEWVSTLDAQLRPGPWRRIEPSPSVESKAQPLVTPSLFEAPAPPIHPYDSIFQRTGADNEKNVDWSARMVVQRAASEHREIVAFRLPPHGWTTDGKPSDSMVSFDYFAWALLVPARTLLVRTIGDFDRGRYLDQEFWILQPTKEPHCRKLIDGSALGPDSTGFTRADPRDDGSILFHGWGHSRFRTPERGRIVWIGIVDAKALDGPLGALK